MLRKKKIKLGNINSAFFDHKKELLAVNFLESPEDIHFAYVDDNFVSNKNYIYFLKLNLESFKGGPVLSLSPNYL